VSEDSPPRRDFLKVVTGAAIVTGAGAAAWPLIASLRPDDSVKNPLRFDLSEIGEGQFRIGALNNTLYIVRHLSQAEIAELAAVPLAALRDRMARNANRPVNATAEVENRVIDGAPSFVVIVGVCTRLECVLLLDESGETARNPSLGRCPCCGSSYDLLGRVQSGPATLNTAIPRIDMVGDVILSVLP
jgi:ubiquinol-cytochrome c reductase iron-sulfur subunit